MWVMASMIYLYLEYLLMFFAMIQSFKILKYLDQEVKNKLDIQEKDLTKSNLDESMD